MPITNGNTWLEFRYNGVDYTLPYANVNAYESKPVFAEDGFTMLRYEVTLQGTALVSDGTATFADLANKFTMGTGTVERLRLYCVVGGGTQTLLDVSFPDAMRGPSLSINVTEISGGRACMVSFTASASIVKAGEEGIIDPTYPVVGHRWTSRVALDANGNPTRTVTGSLTVNLAATGTLETPATSGSIAQIQNKKPLADLFRKAILPATASLPGKWRRESQTFAYNEAGNALLYEITDVQVRTDVPDGAFSGNAEFSYERTRANAMANLRFSCDLEGQVNGDVRRLIWAAVVLCQSRISFTKSLITRMVVNEQEMFSKAKIRFEIEAETPAVAVDSPSTTQIAVPLANLVGKYFSVSRSCDWSPDAYGVKQAGLWMRPHWQYNETNAKPDGIHSLAVAEIVQELVGDCAPSTPTFVFTGDSTDFTAANAAVAVGPYDTQTADFLAGKIATVEKSFTTTAVLQSTAMHRLQTLYTQGEDFVFQAGKASVILEETTTVKRVNDPPQRVFRPIPPGTIVLSEDWRVNHGEIDAAGNRVFTGVYVRRVMTYDGGGATFNGYYTESDRRQWWETSVAAPLTLGSAFEYQQSSASAFEVTASYAYQTGTAQDYYSA